MMSDNIKPVIITVSKKRTFSDKSIVLPLYEKKHHVIRKYTKKVSDIQNYALPEVETLPINKLKQPNILLPFKLYSKQRDNDRFKRHMNVCIYEKYKIKSTDLQKRLQVDYLINDLYCVTDIDEDYYRYLEGRPLRLPIPGIKSFKISLNKILQLRLDTGTKNDSLLKIEVNHRNELDTYSLAVKRLTDQAKYFDAFISEGYKNSMDFLTKWDKLKLQLDLKIKELQNVAIDNFTIKSRLIGLEYKYSLQQKYGRFLYYLAPPTWRLRNRQFARSVEIEEKGFDFANSQEEDTFAIIFEKLQKVCCGTAIKPALYFTEPEKLMEVFSAMENQQLHYYTLAIPHAKLLKKNVTSLKDVFFQDDVTNSIKFYENLLNFSEDRCAQLEAKFFKILFGLFYNSVGVSDVLKLISHLEFCYEKLFLEKPINIDLIVMAKSIEMLYMDYSKRLDKIQSNTVRRTVLKCTERERLKTQKAKRAATELRLFNRLELNLLKAYGINTENINTSIQRNTIKKTIKRHNSSFQPESVKCKRNSLTEAEMEYLLLFTDWTDDDDPGNYLQSKTY